MNGRKLWHTILQILQPASQTAHLFALLHHGQSAELFGLILSFCGSQNSVRQWPQCRQPRQICCAAPLPPGVLTGLITGAKCFSLAIIDCIKYTVSSGPPICWPLSELDRALLVSATRWLWPHRHAASWLISPAQLQTISDLRGWHLNVLPEVFRPCPCRLMCRSYSRLRQIDR